MKAATIRKISMARSAYNFATAHPVADSGFTTVLAGLKSDVESADSLGMLQSAGPQRQHAAVSERLALKQSIRSLQLGRLCTGRQARLHQPPGVEESVRAPRRQRPEPDFPAPGASDAQQRDCPAGPAQEPRPR